jgi:hypothetical protein
MPCRAVDQHDVALLVKEVPACQVADQRLVHRRLLEVELVDFLGQRQLGDGELLFDRARLLLADLGVQQVADDLLRLVLPLHGRRDDLVIGRARGILGPVADRPSLRRA